MMEIAALAAFAFGVFVGFVLAIIYVSNMMMRYR